MKTPQSQIFTVTAQHAGQTLAAFLRASIPGLSWSDARAHIHSRRTRVNGSPEVDDARRLRAGDTVELSSVSASPAPRSADIAIVYSDDDLLIIDKPSGMQCERRPEERSWSAQRKERSPVVVEALLKRGYRVWPVHRLDRDTSGLMIYALTAPARERLVKQFSQHQIGRTYLALASGIIDHPIDVRSWIIRDRGDGLRGSIPQPRSDADEAISHFKPIETIAEKFTLLECHLETGRTHQIRIHLAEIGHPICGEKLYLKPSPGAAAIADQSGATRQFLHSAKLQLTLPSGRELKFQSPLPQDLNSLLQRLRGR